MAISGLMVTLCAGAREAEQALRALSTDRRLTLGERVERRLAIVAETPSAEHDAELWNDLRALPGIENVDVTFVSVDGENADSTEGSPHVNA